MLQTRLHAITLPLSIEPFRFLLLPAAEPICKFSPARLRAWHATRRLTTRRTSPEPVQHRPMRPLQPRSTDANRLQDLDHFSQNKRQNPTTNNKHQPTISPFQSCQCPATSILLWPGQPAQGRNEHVLFSLQAWHVSGCVYVCVWVGICVCLRLSVSRLLIPHLRHGAESCQGPFVCSKTVFLCRFYETRCWFSFWGRSC